MAVIATYVDDRDYVYPDQYINIHKVTASKTSMDVEVAIFHSQKSFADGEPPHTAHIIKNVAFDMFDTRNVWQQGYVGIKEFWPDSVDC